MWIDDYPILLLATAYSRHVRVFEGKPVERRDTAIRR